MIAEGTPGELKSSVGSGTVHVRLHDAAQRPEAEALLAAARAAGLRIGVLTNETELLQGRAWIERVDVFRSVDALVDASITGIMKPDPAAYRLALEALALPADRVLFVDDQAKNVTGAEAVGIAAVRFDPTDVAGSFSLVRRRLGLDSADVKATR